MTGAMTGLRAAVVQVFVPADLASGLAILEFPGHSWEEIDRRAGSLIAFVTPSAFGGDDV